jgi:hypothetical protein
VGTVVNHSKRDCVVVHRLPDGRWKVSFPDGLTVLTVDDRGIAFALVPTGHEFQVIPREDA